MKLGFKFFTSTCLAPALASLLLGVPLLNEPVSAERFTRAALKLEPPSQSFAKKRRERLDPVEYSVNGDGMLSVSTTPKSSSVYNGQIAGRTRDNRILTFTLQPKLQKYAETLISEASAPHAAIVAMEPFTGKILAIAGRSSSLDNAALHSGYRAASLFKIITSAAALERSQLEPNSPIRYRGGTYTLNKWNFKPSSQRDNRVMSFQTALAKSCNPAFARIALGYLDHETVEHYLDRFHFNDEIPFELPTEPSAAHVPDGEYDFARTAAGFGEVYISPIHAATLMSSVANGGMLPQPTIVDRILNNRGTEVSHMDSEVIARVLQPSTAFTLMNMMEATTTEGTSRREFFVGKKPRLPNVRVAGKTGTLRGKVPAGINNWFIGAAPIEDPSLVVAVVVVDPNRVTTKASRLARKLIEHQFKSS